jgi:hypothetical protein
MKISTRVAKMMNAVLFLITLSSVTVIAEEFPGLHSSRTVISPTDRSSQIDLKNVPWQPNMTSLDQIAALHDPKKGGHSKNNFAIECVSESVSK